MGSVVAPSASASSMILPSPASQAFVSGARPYGNVVSQPVVFAGTAGAAELDQAANANWPQPSVTLERPPPPALTAGLPDPHQIESQRGSYMKGLDEQLKQGADVLNQQLKQQQDNLLRMGDQQKRQFGLQVDQQIKHQELELVQQHNHQLLMLQQAAQQQKVALEQQANALLIEYNQKKANEDLASQMFQFENAAADAHRKYQTEIQALQSQQAMGARQLAAQGEALARQASISNMQAIAAQQVASRTSASLTCPMPTSSYLQPLGTTPPASYLPPIQPGFAPPPPSGVSMTGSLVGTGLSTPVPGGYGTTIGTYPTNVVQARQLN